MDQPRPTTRPSRKMFIRDLVLHASIGVHAHEHAARQRVRVNLDLTVTEDPAANLSRPALGRAAIGRAAIGRAAIGRDDLSRVVDYEQIADRVRAIIAAGHVQLVETLAERIAEACLIDPRVTRAAIRVEKLDILADAASVGVEIERRNC